MPVETALCAQLILYCDWLAAARFRTLANRLFRTKDGKEKVAGEATEHERRAEISIIGHKHHHQHHRGVIGQRMQGGADQVLRNCKRAATMSIGTHRMWIHVPLGLHGQDLAVGSAYIQARTIIHQSLIQKGQGKEHDSGRCKTYHRHQRTNAPPY